MRFDVFPGDLMMIDLAKGSNGVLLLDRDRYLGFLSGRAGTIYLDQGTEQAHGRGTTYHISTDRGGMKSERDSENCVWKHLATSRI